MKPRRSSVVAIGFLLAVSGGICVPKTPTYDMPAAWLGLGVALFGVFLILNPLREWTEDQGTDQRDERDEGRTGS